MTGTPGQPLQGQHDPPADAVNEVRLRGRVGRAAVARTLPSGDVLVTSRLIVDRDPATLRRSRQRVDTLDCVAWARRAQRSLLTWVPGEIVEVEGAIRRRFFRDQTAPVSRVEVEVRSARKIASRREPGRHPSGP